MSQTTAFHQKSIFRGMFKNTLQKNIISLNERMKTNQPLELTNEMCQNQDSLCMNLQNLQVQVIKMNDQQF